MNRRTLTTIAALAAAWSAMSLTPRSLAFDPTAYSSRSAELDGKKIAYRAFEGIVYVANPVDEKYQRLNFYVPEAYYSGGSIEGFDGDSAPIFFPNGVGGYMPALPAGPEGTGLPGMGPPPGVAPTGPAPIKPGAPGALGQGGPSTILVALSKGFVVASPGCRGRTLKDGSGAYEGKAPACIVDLKAAVRYLRLNDAAMPGDAERIVSNGTSAGGALSALLGATGNSPDYEPYLRALGAAEARDDIFAASCYCPIADLDHADPAYEWQFSGVEAYVGMDGEGELSAAQSALSARLAALFPDYLNNLGLRKADGSPLVLDAAGGGSFRDYVEFWLLASAQAALAAGKELPAEAGFKVEGGVAADLDLAAYMAYIGRMKTPPAFDALDRSSPENGLFGAAGIDARHFTRAGADGDPAAGPLAEDRLVKLMNPLRYIDAEGATTCRYWRIRHGASDRDTSFAVPLILATKLRQGGRSVDLALPWGRGHGGDYDLDRLFAWAAVACR